MGRLKDAVNAILGRQGSRAFALARIESQWAAILMDITSVMEKLTAIEGRLAKREARARKPDKAPEPVALPVPTPITGKDAQATRKAQLRARAAALRHISVPNGHEGHNGDGSEL